MGAAPSTPRLGAVAGAAASPGAAEQMFAALVGGKAYPISSEFWRQLLELPLTQQWPRDRVLQACHAFAQNNYHTKHLAKILIHLVWCLQECMAESSHAAYRKAINAAYISSIFLKFIIENAKTDNWQELSLEIDKDEKGLENFPSEQSVEYFLMRGVLNYIGSVDQTLYYCHIILSTTFVSSNAEGASCPLGRLLLLVLLILIHYRKCITTSESFPSSNVYTSDLNTNVKDAPAFHDNPYYKALSNAKDSQYDRADVEGNAQNGLVVRLSFASLFDALGTCLKDESSVLLLYSLVHGNCDFQEYVLVRTDLDTLLMPILEMLYNASRKTSNQIYMLLIVLLILSQDSTFNASVHKLVLPSVPWYHERLMHQTSLGSLMVVILIRTIKYNLSKLRDVYLHTNCLAILANMAPHVHRLSAYASQRLVSLFDMLSRKYTKLAELKNDKAIKVISDQIEADNISDDTSTELHIYTDFLRIVLEIINAILTYALPRNPEVVYAILHRQEVFQPFKNHPRFNELLENIYTVLDFFNSRMDMQQLDGEWSVDKVLEVINKNCRSWRGEGMKMFTQLRFTYEQESHPEEFFIPYAWRVVLSRG
ncbi:hypothetical protein OsI_03918 [Oryza sativa Indica Group]|uniref:Dymeclin n=1 Tax=Oryza sativa subsp. indica TaxID=39946 RepID=B8AA63_ORYSI|nr:hypothetical protein OsI_03918 [Oryza sativa Indica Group]